MQVLVTGGAGYIGSVIVHKLIKKNYNVIVIDNLEFGHKEYLPKNIKFYFGDIGNEDLLGDIFSQNNITHVIHCAAYADVKESMENPIKYFNNNISKSIKLLNIMNLYNCKNIIFSSTCATYGICESLPLTENTHQNPINAYGYSKLAFEQILKYMEQIYNFNVVILRYFNVAGAYIDNDNDIIVGENHNPETHLIPLAINALINDKSFNIYGNDYNTKDGTCIRDYIHIEDLADAHILVLNKKGIFNLGSENGYSVKEIVDLIQQIGNKKLQINLCSRRDGDPAILYANSTKFKTEFNWKPKHGIESIIKNAYQWHLKLKNT